jgi:hypothetical protein
LNDLAKAIRGEAQPEPEPNAEFTSEVLVLLQKTPGATASDIFAALKSDGLVEKQPNVKVAGRKKKERVSDDAIKVAGRIFEKKQRALDAINDLAKKVNRELARP